MKRSFTIFRIVLCAFLLKYYGFCQPIFTTDPTTYQMYLGENETLTLDGNTNVVNGASCLDTFEVYSSSPDNPSWASNNGLELNFYPTLLSHVKSYVIQYYVVETGIGACTFIPSVRELTLTVNKRHPEINYAIENYTDLRAAIPFEVAFPQPLCSDPHNDTLSYHLLTESNGAPPTYFHLDTVENKIYGTIPNPQAGTYTLKLQCSDSINQFASQLFTWTFNSNQMPSQVIIDTSIYAFIIGEGQSFEYTLPSGIYTDADGDPIYYDSAFFNDFTALQTWVEMSEGFEGDAKLVFTSVPITSKTGFQVFVSDNIGSASKFFQLNFTVNQRPVASSQVVSIDLYPNLDLSVDLELDIGSYFTDNEGDSLLYTFWDVPSNLIIKHKENDTYEIKGDFNMSISEMNFTFTADDNYSLPTDITFKLVIQGCHNDCERCFGSAVSECYSCSGGNVLDSSTCLSNCPVDKYNNTGVCDDCHDFCDGCHGSSAYDCDVCDINYFMKNSQCVDDCGNYYFGYDNECIRCASPFCLACSGEMLYDCTQCQAGYVLTNGNCIDLHCAEGYYIEGSQCEECDDSCDSCTAGTNSDCNVCASGYGFNEENECISCEQMEGYMTGQDGSCYEICGDGLNLGMFECDDGNRLNNDGCDENCKIEDGFSCTSNMDSNDTCHEISGPTCSLSSIQNNIVTLSCSRRVIFLEDDDDELFKFNVEGPRKYYEFSMKLLENLVIGRQYQSIKFEMTPYSTYIGLDEEKLVLTFIAPHLIVTSSSRDITIANNRTSITIYDSSDAIPEDVDTVSTVLGYIMGFGTAASLGFSFGMKLFFGGNFNLGWGLINFIQIAAFIPLADFYFPGNVRGFVSMLKIANTAGRGLPNMFYLFINENKLDHEPYNNRFDVMGIDTTIFIANCGPQISMFAIVLVLILLAKLLKALKSKIKIKALKWVINKIYSYLTYNTFIRMLILLYMYFLLSGGLTAADVHFANGHEAFSYLFGLIGLLGLLGFIFTIFGIIQTKTKQIQASPKFRKRYDCITADIDFSKNCARFYIPIYLLRRAVFVGCLIIFGRISPVSIQFTFLIAHCILMLATASILRPYTRRIYNMTAIFNEIMITILMGFSGVFMMKDLNNNTAIDLGWGWIGIASFTITANWIIFISIQIYDIIQKRKEKILAKNKNAIQDVEMNEVSRNVSKDVSAIISPFEADNPQNTHIKKNIIFLDGSSENYDPTEKTMVTPMKGNIQNHYEEGIYEEEKVPIDEMQDIDDFTPDCGNKVSKRKRRVASISDDIPVPFGYTPTSPTIDSPTRVLSKNSSDGINSRDDFNSSNDSDFGIEVEIRGETEYPESPAKVSKGQSSRKSSDNLSQDDSQVSSFRGYNSSSNILKLQRISDPKDG